MGAIWNDIYFLQMVEFLGIPVIAWNADNAGLESVIISPLLWNFQLGYMYRGCPIY